VFINIAIYGAISLKGGNIGDMHQNPAFSQIGKVKGGEDEDNGKYW
jgi:hypothetical protein